MESKKIFFFHADAFIQKLAAVYEKTLSWSCLFLVSAGDVDIASEYFF